MLCGFALGLALAPAVAGVPVSAGAATGAAALVALAATRPRTGRTGSALVWLACFLLASAILGLAVGAARLAAIDRGALDLEPGRGVLATGFVTAVPRRSDGEVRIEVETADGRLLVEAREPVGELSVGGALRATGTIRDPDDWEADYLHRLGVRNVLVAQRLELLRDRRGGLSGLLDGVRNRAQAALGDGTTPEAANLLRGFVLGQDDLIDPGTREDFKRSGLAHLLAVSGQNIVLLAVLAAVVLALLGVPLRARLGWILVLIAIYVPVAGAGASIQRAGVMGAAGIVAVLAGRPRSRWYAVALAACVTLALDPRSSADIGWQLSFAAVIGILLAAAPLARAFGPGEGGWRYGLAQAVALTIAATLATAPLMVHHFGTVSVVALPANLIALPAVAPVMWLGMLVAAGGQISWLPLEPLTWLAGVIAAFIAQVAKWFAAPAWSQVETSFHGPLTLVGAYAALGLTTALALAWASRRRRLRLSSLESRRPLRGSSSRRRVALALALGALAVLVFGRLGVGDGGAESDLRITVLDVGQGDSILLEPRGADPLLIDTGSPEAGVASILAERGVERLAALILTHPDSDHDGDAEAILNALPTQRLVFARARPATVRAARATGARPVRVAAGTRLLYGGLRLRVLWPPPQRLDVTRTPDAREAPAAEPNLLSLVVLARWRGFEALLTGDAEAEAAAIDPGRVDLLKVAHHGSEDTGLASLLERTDPRLALISVGADNPYGHPSPTTLTTLAGHDVPVLRTDRDGEITVAVDGGAWGVVE